MFLSNKRRTKSVKHEGLVKTDERRRRARGPKPSRVEKSSEGWDRRKGRRVVSSPNNPLTCLDVVNFGRDISSWSVTFQRRCLSSTRDFTHLARIPHHPFGYKFTCGTPPLGYPTLRASWKNPPWHRLAFEKYLIFPVSRSRRYIVISFYPWLSTSYDFRGCAAKLEAGKARVMCT